MHIQQHPRPPTRFDVTAWMADGNCRMYPPATFFPSDGAGVDKARRICATCLGHRPVPRVRPRAPHRARGLGRVQRTRAAPDPEAPTPVARRRILTVVESRSSDRSPGQTTSINVVGSLADLGIGDLGISDLVISGSLGVLRAPRRAVLELLLRLAEVLGQLRELRTAEQDENDDEDDDGFWPHRCSCAAHYRGSRTDAMLRATWARWRRIRRRSRSDSPPQMPNFSPFWRANSRHSSRTTQPRQTSLASRSTPPLGEEQIGVDAEAVRVVLPVLGLLDWCIVSSYMVGTSLPVAQRWLWTAVLLVRKRCRSDGVHSRVITSVSLSHITSRSRKGAFRDTVSRTLADRSARRRRRSRRPR